MSTARQRQQQRERDAILTEAVKLVDHARRQRQIAALDAERGPGTSLVALASTWEAQIRMRAPLPKVNENQLAAYEQNLETIVAAEYTNPETGEVYTVEKTKRVASLADQMGKEGQLSMPLAMAAQTFKELFLSSLGPSRGVSSYGDYAPASEPSKRIATTDDQMQAYDDLKKAAIAAFGVIRKDGRWALDEQLMQLVVPAILSGKKSVTQGWIGQQRTRYTGAKQVTAGGGVIVQEVLQRLSLHFHYRER